MSDIGPGDFVECVIGSLDGRHRVGDVYRLACFGPTPARCHHDNCGLAGYFFSHEQPLPRRGACPNRFRPIYRPKSEIIESLKTPAPKELEPA